jgi:acetylornithine deacetylase
MNEANFQIKEKVTGLIQSAPDHAINLLVSLLKEPSVNPWFSPDYPGGEKKAQQVLAEELKRLGAEIKMWEPSAEHLKDYAQGPGYYADHKFDQRPNLAAKLKGAGGGRSLLLFGHIDVVDPAGNWTVAPFGGEIKNGNIYGRGAADMKGGLAAQVAALEYIKRAGVRLKGDVLVGSVVDEEAGGMGTLAFVAEGYRADAAIVGEPTNLTVAPMCRGILWGKIIIQGRNSHIELPQTHWREGGAVDAIQKARLYLQHIDLMNQDWALRKQHPLLDLPCEIKVAMFNAGDYPTTYASKAEITIDVQYLPSEKDQHHLGSKVKKEIEEMVKRVAQTDEWLQAHPPVVEWMVDADCGEIPATHPFVNLLAGNVRRVMALPGETKVVKGVHCHTDMGLLIDNGIPTVNFGPGISTVAHQPDEYISVTDYLNTVKIIAESLIDWCEVEAENR